MYKLSKKIGNSYEYNCFFFENNYLQKETNIKLAKYVKSWFVYLTKITDEEKLELL